MGRVSFEEPTLAFADVACGIAMLPVEPEAPPSADADPAIGKGGSAA